MDFRSSFNRSGDNTSVQSSADSKTKIAKNPLTFFTQIIVVYMIIITSLVHISLRSPDKELSLNPRDAKSDRCSFQNCIGHS